MARICRASFSAERDVELVIVDADAVDRSKASQFPSHAQHLLEMVNCRDCEKEWPFEAVMGIEPLLEQVEGGSGDVTYLCWQYNGQDLHAVGLGSTLAGHPVGDQERIWHDSLVSLFRMVVANTVLQLKGQMAFSLGQWQHVAQQLPSSTR